MVHVPATTRHRLEPFTTHVRCTFAVTGGIPPWTIKAAVPSAQILRRVDVECDAWIELNRHGARRGDALATMRGTAIGAELKAQCGLRRQMQSIGAAAMLVRPNDEFPLLVAASGDAHQIVGGYERQIGGNDQNRFGSHRAQYFHALAYRVVQVASCHLADRQYAPVGGKA